MEKEPRTELRPASGSIPSTKLGGSPPGQGGSRRVPSASTNGFLFTSLPSRPSASRGRHASPLTRLHGRVRRALRPTPWARVQRGPRKSSRPLPLQAGAGQPEDCVRSVGIAAARGAALGTSALTVPPTTAWRQCSGESPATLVLIPVTVNLVPALASKLFPRTRRLTNNLQLTCR